MSIRYGCANGKLHATHTHRQRENKFSAGMGIEREMDPLDASEMEMQFVWSVIAAIKSKLFSVYGYEF